VIICFAPITISLLYGLFLLPSFFIQAVSYGQNTWPYTATVIGGAFGFFGVLLLLLKYQPGERSRSRRGTIVTCLLVGFIAFAYYATIVLLDQPSVLDLLMFAAPLLSGLHLLYATRHYIFGSSRQPADKY
jgi:peptidoglycan/LPS O-acetylase OafA/YrhL